MTSFGAALCGLGPFASIRALASFESVLKRAWSINARNAPVALLPSKVIDATPSLTESPKIAVFVR